MFSGMVLRQAILENTLGEGDSLEEQSEMMQVSQMRVNWIMARLGVRLNVGCDAEHRIRCTIPR